MKMKKTDSGFNFSSSHVKPKVGISSCLMGNNVRFDGGHKKSKFIMDTLSEFVDFVPICPEVEMGLSTPRETLRLIGKEQSALRLIGNKTRTDYSAGMNDWASKKIRKIQTLELDGFVLQKGSPSCGLERVRMYPDENRKAQPQPKAVGLFAQKLKENLPNLPLCENGWLNDSQLRESFLEKIYTHNRLREVSKENSIRALIKFHADHKFLFLAHSPKGQTDLGRIVANHAGLPINEVIAAYHDLSMMVLNIRTSRGKHTNVLHHILGFVKTLLSGDQKKELLSLIQDFRNGFHSLSVPLTMLKHFVRIEAPEGWIASQIYFEPIPHQIASRVRSLR
jgi:uncharacterized protein YbgA (DUF1722 family)/uncharacterized protein YbbK (DUF523 family)